LDAGLAFKLGNSILQSEYFLLRNFAFLLIQSFTNIGLNSSQFLF
jgi:hypothetical protein